MTERVQYLIAQYQVDPLRKEPRNVGIIARMDGRTVARFLGEKEDGRIDGRELRWMSFPDVYRQWVFYWREAGNAVAQLEQLIESNKGNYGLVRGGKVFDTGSDSLEQVVQYLYTRFVGDGFAAAMREGELPDTSAARLNNALASELATINVLSSAGKALPGVKYPVEKNRKIVLPNAVSYQPEFSQDNGSLWLIQTFDFVSQRAKNLYEHAGLSAYMYSDLKKHWSKKVEPISIMKASAELEETEEVKSSKGMLGNEGRVIDWNDEAARKAFLEERRQVAMSEG